MCVAVLYDKLERGEGGFTYKGNFTQQYRMVKSHVGTVKTKLSCTRSPAKFFPQHNITFLFPSNVKCNNWHPPKLKETRVTLCNIARYIVK